MSTTEMYTFNEHKHRYALWTAARAVQRSFTTTEVICKAIEQTSLRPFAESSETIHPEQFDKLHDAWCTQLMEAIPEPKCSYGRAAKMIAIYLKTAVILPRQGEGSTCEVIHPPIDRVLLSALSKVDGLQSLRKHNWT